MQKPRLNYSVVSLLAAVAFAALACAAVLNADSLWASAVFSFAVGAVFVAMAGAVCRRDERHGFWLCFLAFGGGYLVLAFGPWFSPNVRPYLITSELVSKLYDTVRRIEPRVASGTTVYLASSGRVFINNEVVAPQEIPEKLGSTSPSDIYVFEDDPSAQLSDPAYLKARKAFWNGLRGRYTSANSADAASVSVPRRTHFDRVCHSLWALIFALVGGLVAHWFRRRETVADNRLA